MFDGFVSDHTDFDWLAEKAGGWQFGEQGILFSVSAEIGSSGQCVEIGAGDGVSLPLTINPFYHIGNRCLLYEADPTSAGELSAMYPAAKIRGRFDPESMDAIDSSPLVCVIDVDGIDREIMIDVLRCKTPRILMVEHFDKFHFAHCTQSDPLPDWSLGLELANGFKLQDNEAAINRIGKMFDYVRLGTTRVNSIFVHKKYAEKLKR